MNALQKIAQKNLQVKRERDAWKEFATHLMCCGVCSNNCYDCETGMELMIAIRVIDKYSKKFIDSDEITAALKGEA